MKYIDIRNYDNDEKVERAMNVGAVNRKSIKSLPNLHQYQYHLCYLIIGLMMTAVMIIVM